MKILESSSGYVLYEEGSRVILVDQQTRGLAVILFVFGLIALVCSVNAVIFIVQAMMGNFGFMPAFVLVPVALAGIFIFRTAILRYKKFAQTPPNQFPAVVIFDLERGALLDKHEKEIAPLSAVRITKRLQIGSSSPALVAKHEGGSTFLISGHPFLGGLGSFPHIFRQRGWMD
jgi:hypothetical protein